MAWSNEVTFKFIELYRNEAAIWNPKNSLHKDKSAISDAWERISSEMDIPVEVLKKKKETLMAAFRFNHKKKLASLRTGDPRDVFHPIWIFYERMADFLEEVFEYKGGNPFSDDASSSISFQEKWNPVVEIGVEDLSNEEPASKRRRGDSLEPDPTPTSDHYVASTMSTLASLLNVVSKDIVKGNKDEDECELFGKLTAMKLRELPVTERRVLMYEIDTLIIQKLYKSEPSLCFGSPDRNGSS